MKKNGFISISVVYSFFLVFLVVLIAIINNYANNRLLLKNMKTDIIDNLSMSHEPVVLATHLIGLYTTDGSNGIYYHDKVGTFANLEAGDNSYRFAGTNPRNYVCFGSSASTCPDANLYRIIGVFNYNGVYKVKLIKNTSYGNYYWSGTSSNRVNVWASSSLNTSTLNSSFLNSLGSPWNTMIDSTTWYVGGLTVTNGRYAEQIAKTAFDYEVGSSKITGNFSYDCDGSGSGTTSCSASSTYTNKIGLMYLSDFYYAAFPDFWSLKGYDASGSDYRRAALSNWLNTGVNEWTIARLTSDSTNYIINELGYMESTAPNNISAVIRPTFNLTSSVKFNLGTGTQSNPYRLTQ